MSEWNVPVQSLIDHIKTAVDVDPWAKEMAEELLKKQEPKIIRGFADTVEGVVIGNCPRCDRLIVGKENDPAWFCKYCGQEVIWE